MARTSIPSIQTTEVVQHPWYTQLFSRIPFIQKIFFVTHLKVMLGAGLSIIEAFDILEKQTEHRLFKNTITEMKHLVEQGDALGEVLARFPKIFPKIYVNMVRAGEVSGTLEQALHQIGVQMKKTNEMNRSIQGAMVYPVIIILSLVGIGIEMTLFVLPKLLTIFEEFGAELPLPTRILIGVSSFLTGWGGWVVLLLLICTTVLFFWLLKKPKWKRIIHTGFLHLLLIGPIIKKVQLARFSLTLHSLIKSTIPIIESFQIAASVLGNVVYGEALRTVSEKLKKGETISTSLELFPKLFPPLLTQMIRVGERSGTLENLLQELSNFYGEEVDATMKNISTIIEPLLIVFLGLVVAGMAVAVIMPIYNLSQNF